MDACTRILREAIVEGELSPGEKLLPERELARRLGVNRVTVRSALERLASGRLVEARQGSGHRVRDFRRTGGLELLPIILGDRPKRKRTREVLRDLLLLRRTLLGLAIERVSEGIADDAKVRLLDAITDLESIEDPERLGAQERVVIDTLLEAAGSVVLRLSLNPVLAILDAVPTLDEALTSDPGGGVEVWRKLAVGLSRGRKKWPAEVVAELARHDLALLTQLKKKR